MLEVRKNKRVRKHFLNKQPNFAQSVLNLPFRVFLMPKLKNRQISRFQGNSKMGILNVTGIGKSYNYSLMKKQNQTQRPGKDQNQSKNEKKRINQRKQNVPEQSRADQTNKKQMASRKSKRISHFSLIKGSKMNQVKRDESEFSPAVRPRNRKPHYDKPSQQKRRLVIELCTRQSNPLKQIEAAKKTGLHESTVRMILKLWRDKGKLSVSAEDRRYKQAVQLINTKNDVDIIKLIKQSKRNETQQRHESINRTLQINENVNHTQQRNENVIRTQQRRDEGNHISQRQENISLQEPIQHIQPVFPQRPLYRSGLNYVVNCPAFIPHPQDPETLLLTYVPIVLTATAVHPQVLQHSMFLCGNNSNSDR